MNSTILDFPARTCVARRPAVAPLVALVILTAATARGDEPAPNPVAGPVLTLCNGGIVPGVLADTSRPKAFGWHAESFATPFDFLLDEVLSVRFPTTGKPPVAAGAFGFELTSGDVLFGSVLQLDDRVAELSVAQLGRIKIERARILRIFRWRDGAEVIYHGPNGLTGWREFTPPRPALKAAAGPVAGVNFAINNRANTTPLPQPEPTPTGPGWVDDGGSLLATRAGVSIQTDAGLPARAAVEVELSWKQPPNFVLALGVGDDEAVARQAFRLEIWDNQIVALRETEKEADLASIYSLGGGPGRVRFQLYLDQEQGRLQVFSEASEPLADLKLGGGAGNTLPGIRITNLRGDLRLERLRVDRWDGETTPAPKANEPHALLTDRSVVRGPLDRYDAAAREFVVGQGAGATRIAEDRLQGVEFFPPEEALTPSVRMVYSDGTRIAGNWIGVEGHKLFLTAAGITGLVGLPADGLRALQVVHPTAPPRSADDATGMIELNGVRMLGRLVNSTGRPGEGCLAWQPLASDTASLIRPGTSGTIRFLKPVGKPAANAERAAPPNAREVRIPTARPRQATPDAAIAALPRSIYLRTGDIVPAEVTKIDEQGVYFQSNMSESHFVPNARIKAVELAADEPPLIRISKTKLERLLTLPRMQKDSPPTHLIRSRNGDLLRGRVVAMDDKTLRVEVRLEERELPRDRVSRLIWFHADETDPTKKPADPPERATSTRVQAVRNDGIRLTFNAESLTDGVITGKSDVLGICKVNVLDLDQLLLGGSVEKEATQLAYQNFKLRNALEPKSAQEDADGSAGGEAAGTESALVGKPAPDFTLDLLGGAKFHLADHKGKVVVLDFWATWCGPCLQAMPQIDRATRDFADKGVELIAVNLQEAPAKINAMLERQKLSPTVALDKSGSVANKYGATAIPQTVVIDREGKIARLFVGGGPHLEDQLRAALQALQPPKQP